MYVGKSLISGIQQHTVRFLLRGHGSSWILAGTLAVAGLGAATLNRPASAPAQPDHGGRRRSSRGGRAQEHRLAACRHAGEP